jgi:integrase
VFEADTLRGVWIDPEQGDMLFDELADRWFATKVHLRETTKLQYSYLLKKHLRPYFGERPIGSITVLDVQTWLADRHAKTNLCANSVAKAYKVLRMVMEVAVDAGLILRTPCRVKGAATERLPEMRAATPEEVAAIASVVEPRWQALVLMAAYSGLRWGELAGLRQKHLDPLHKKVRVLEQLLEVNGRLMFAPPKTAAGVRTVALPQFLVEVIVEHVARFSQPGPEGLVFVMPEGTPLRRENFRRRVWYPAVAAVGMEGFRFHDLRHTNATLAAASGAPLVALMARLGHASAAAAIRYQHKIEGQDESVAEFLESVGRAAGTGVPESRSIRSVLVTPDS